MKVLIDYRIFFIQKYGGVSRYFLELADELKKTNTDVKILAPIYVNEYINKKKISFFGIKKIKNIPLFSTKILNFINFTICNNYIKISKPNIVHQTYYNNLFYKTNKAIKIINVWDLNHEIYSKSYNLQNNQLPKKKSLDYSDHIICSSLKTQNDLIKYYKIDKERTSVLYQGVPLFTKKIENFKKAERPFLLYVGSRKRYKNFKNVLKALSINKKILNDFDLVCFGGEEFTKDENNLINELKIEKTKIKHFLGDDKKLIEFYSTATAMIYPSKNEGFGFPPLEAMSFDCPVLTSNNEAINEAVGNAAVKFNAESPEEINHAIEKILYSNDLRKNLIELGRKRVKIFTWQNTILNLNKIYKKFI